MNEKKEKKGKWGGEKRFYLFTAIGCAAVLVAIIVIAVAVSAGGEVEPSTQVQNSASADIPVVEEPKEDDEPVVVVPTTESMALPIATATVSNEFGFYHNQTLNNYYTHTGVDFVATAGTEVVAALSGTIESIYKDDVLLGTEIVVNHGDGLKTVYRFVTEKEGLKVGDSVENGEVIATVSEPTGNEYKDGAHLHFEVLENGEQVDPTLHLTLEEK